MAEISSTPRPARVVLAAGIGLAAAFLVVDALVESLAFGRDGFLEALLRPDPEEVWMRAVVTLLLVGFAFAAQVALNRLRDTTAALERSERRFRSVWQSSADAMVVADEAGTIVLCNQAASRTFGDPGSALVGRPLSSLVPERLRFRHQGAFDEVVRNRRAPSDVPRATEFVALRHDGEEFPVELMISSFEAGEERYFVGSMRDISARARATRELEEMRDRLQLSVDRMPIAYILWEADGTVTEWNPAAEKIFGYRRDEAVGRSVIELIIPEAERERVRRVTEKLLSRPNATFSGLEKSVRKDGTPISCRWFNAPIRRGDEPACAILSMALDVTEARRGEEIRHLLTTAIEQAAEAVVITDADAAIQYVNPAFEKLSGYGPFEVVGKTPNVLKSGVHDADFYRELWETITSGRVWSGRMVNRRKDGVLVEEEVTISPVRDERGVITHFVALKRDVSAEAELEARLRQAQKMEALGLLAGGIAHDFNNILVPILGYTDLARVRVEEGDPLLEDLDQVAASAHRARELVDQILSFSRKTAREHRPIQLDIPVREAMRLLKASLPSTIELSCTVEEGIGAVRADATEIHQIVMNLATNSHHAMGEGGGKLEIDLRAVPAAGPGGNGTSRRGSSCARLTVRDTGSGMEVETLERLFEPFYTTKAQGEGTGLGLSVVHGIVSASGGTIRVDSRLGVGTTFEIDFPVEAAAEVEEEDVGPGAWSGSGRILLVEDEEAAARACERMLGQMGYSVTVAHRGEEALRAFGDAGAGFTAVLTDQIMPGMTGTQLARALREIAPNIPVVLASGTADFIDPTEIEGLDGVIRKPFLMRELSRVLQSALGPSGEGDRFGSVATAPEPRARVAP